MLNIKKDKKCVENFIKLCTKVAYEKYGLIFEEQKIFGYFDCLEDVLKYLELIKKMDNFRNDMREISFNELSKKYDFRKIKKLYKKILDIENNILNKCACNWLEDVESINILNIGNYKVKERN